MSKAALSAIFLTATAVLAGCNQPAQDPLRVDEGWVSMAPVPGRPAAVYFNVHGGNADNRLINVTTDVAIRSEMHESINDGGVMKMAPLDGVDIPAKGEVKFAPGGKHVMLFSLNPGIQAGRYISLIFTFANGEQIEYDAIVRAAAGPAHKG